MTDRPAFSDTPQGSKTAGNTGSSLESEAFIAECAATENRMETYMAEQRETFRRLRPDPQPQTFDLTYRFTGTTKHDSRLMLEGIFRAGLPRGVTFKEVTENGARAHTGSFGDGFR